MLRATLAVIAPLSARTRPICPSFTCCRPCHRLRSRLFSRGRRPSFLSFCVLRLLAGPYFVPRSKAPLGGRLGAPTPTPAAPVLVWLAPHGAPHASSTHSPSRRAITLPPWHTFSFFRSVWRSSTAYNSLPSPPQRVAGAASTRRSIFCLSRGTLPSLALTPGPLALPSPAADLPGGGSLKHASEAAPAPFAAALATLTRFCSRARAGLILSEAGSRGGPAAPLPPCQGPPHSSAPAHPAPHTLSTPLPSLISPSPSTSTSTSPSPLTLLAASGHNDITPPNPSVEPRVRPYAAFLCCGSFLVFSIKQEKSII